MCGWSVLGSVPLMGSGVFDIVSPLARWMDSKLTHYFPI